MGQQEHAQRWGCFIDLTPLPHGLIDPLSGDGRSEMPSLRAATNNQQEFQVRPHFHIVSKLSTVSDFDHS
jgi:hypothetical protein